MKEVFLYHGTEEQFQEMLDSCIVTKFAPRPGINLRKKNR